MSRKDEILELKEVLLARRESLRKALAGDLCNLQGNREHVSSDIVDIASDSVQDEISSQLAEVEGKELAQIEHALERIDAGEYGTCEHCDCNIPIARLRALPFASYCINCQREAELEGGTQRSNINWGRLLDVPVSTDNDITTGGVGVDVS